MIIARGALEPGPSHTLRGTVTFTQDGSEIRFETSADFFFDGSPEPGFALTRGFPTDPNDPALQADMAETDFLRLPAGIVNVEGVQSGILSSDIVLDDFDTLVLWCFQIPSILGLAAIAPE